MKVTIEEARGMLLDVQSEVQRLLLKYEEDTGLAVSHIRLERFAQVGKKHGHLTVDLHAEL